LPDTRTCEVWLDSPVYIKVNQNVKDRHQGERIPTRRGFLGNGIIFTGAALAGMGLLRGAEKEKKDEEKETEVGPPEDLMREHGVLKRVLLIYGEVLRRIDSKQDFPPEALADAARIIRSFVGLSRETRGKFSLSAFRKSQFASRSGERASHSAPGWATSHRCDDALC
jgi:hypothetical protein